MSVIASLVRAYDRLPDAPPFGFSQEKVGFCVVLRGDGSVESVIDLRTDDKKRAPKSVMVPRPPKRTSGVAPNFLWDNAGYVLGISAPIKGVEKMSTQEAEKEIAKLAKKTVKQHEAFRAFHLDLLSETSDEGLAAFRRFIDEWRPEMFSAPVWPEDVGGANLIFALSSEYRDGNVHDRPAAREIWSRLGSESGSERMVCLVSGELQPIARLHGSIKGVRGAQSSGASLVSFNLDAFCSYGHAQGANAPISESAAFAYAAVINRFLEYDSGHKVQIGDTAALFWADSSDMAAAESSEGLFASLFNPKDEDRITVSAIRSRLDAARQGALSGPVNGGIPPDVRFCVLGLAPNAARLSVRFFWEDTFGKLAENYGRYLDDTEILPASDRGLPTLWRYLREMEPPGDNQTAPPLIGGEWMRSILSGDRYPSTLLPNVLLRVRSDGKINPLRCSILKSVLIRNMNMEVPVALDTENTNRGYLLGRLFAVYERVQDDALGSVNAGIRDKFYGSASSSPRKVFRALDAGASSHLSKVRKASKGRAIHMENLIISIMDLMSPADDPIPASLSAAEQAMFGIGYYHQRSEFFRKKETKTEEVKA